MHLHLEYFITAYIGLEKENNSYYLTGGTSDGHKFGLSFSNDFFWGIGDKCDRWRTFAAEVSYDNYSFGVMVGTNDGKTASKGHFSESENESIAGKFDKWDNGKVYIAPAWFGIKQGNQITRFGMSKRNFQDATQNVLHKYWPANNERKAKYYLDYTQMYEGPYTYRGYNNPFSLWNR